MAALGAYGFRIELDGDGDGARWLVPQPDHAPVLRLRRVCAELPRGPRRVDGEVLDLGLTDGVRIRARRGDVAVEFISPRSVSDGELIHPLLANPAAMHWAWRGGESLHAGAFVLDGGAVLVLGTNATGKTTILDQLAAEHRLPVLADDLAIIDDGEVLCGPRGLDLRAPPSGAVPAPAMPSGELVREGQRLRRTLDGAPARAPLRAWVALGWGKRLALERLDVAAKLRELAAARRVHAVLGDGSPLVDLAALPALRLSRPRDPDGLGQSIALMLDRLA